MLATVSSCTSIKNTASTASVDTQIYNLTVADLKVAPEKVSKTTSWSWNPFNQVNLDREKKNTTAGILRETGSDVLVEPQYDVQRRGVFRGGSLTVTGYPATYSNFRTMNREDAENLAIVNGKLSVTSTTAVPTVTNATDIVAGVLAGTTVKTGPGFSKKQKPAPGIGRHKEEFTTRHFLSVLGGATICGGIGDSHSGNIGLIYGQHGRRWGFYLKGSVYWDGMEEDYYYEPIDLKKTTFYGTIGVIKTLPFGFNIMAGAGFGGIVGKYGNYIEPCAEVRAGIPLEAMLQWEYKQFNIIGGVTYIKQLNEFNGIDDPLNLSVGIGYNF